MSIEALNRAWKSRQPGTRKLVLLAIANVADQWGYAIVGGDYLAGVCNVDLRSIRRHIKALEEAGELRRFREGGGRHIANTYQVILGLTPEEIARSETESEIAVRGKLSKNGDKMSSFQPKNGDKMSPHTLINAAAVKDLINTAAAAKNVYSDKMSLFREALDKFVHPSKNGDKMSLFLNVGESALQAGWSGSLERLAQLVVAHAEQVHESDFTLAEAVQQAEDLNWRGGKDDLIAAWLQEPDRVRALLAYARRKEWGGGLLRMALRSGEWPPNDALDEIDPAAKYKRDPFAQFYE